LVASQYSDSSAAASAAEQEYVGIGLYGTYDTDYDDMYQTYVTTTESGDV